METTNKNDFINNYILKTLNEIKGTIKCNIKLDKAKEEEIDKKMIIVLNDLINSNFKNLQKDAKDILLYTLPQIIEEEENKKSILYLALYYTALYYDNVDLLHVLLKEKIRFEENHYINLQYLDKSISSKFERKKYIEMIKTCGYIFRNFTKSIENLTKEEREQYIQRFVKLINLKYDLIKNILNKNSWYTGLEHLFDKTNLDTFTDETYEQATEEQLKSFTNEEIKKLNHTIRMMNIAMNEGFNTLNHTIGWGMNSFSQTKKIRDKTIKFFKTRF